MANVTEDYRRRKQVQEALARLSTKREMSSKELFKTDHISEWQRLIIRRLIDDGVIESKGHPNSHARTLRAAAEPNASRRLSDDDYLTQLIWPNRSAGSKPRQVQLDDEQANKPNGNGSNGSNGNHDAQAALNQNSDEAGQSWRIALLSKLENASDEERIEAIGELSVICAENLVYMRETMSLVQSQLAEVCVAIQALKKVWDA